MSKSDFLILTGMHRSGTSLMASILQSAGVNVGKNLLEPDKRNPHGFFEDNSAEKQPAVTCPDYWKPWEVGAFTIQRS